MADQTNTCPRCAEQIEEMQSGVWLFNGSLYCSEKCCREAANAC